MSHFYIYYAASARCVDGDGSNYVGTVAITDAGYICQRWDSQYPHSHTYTDPDYFTEGKLS